MLIIITLDKLSQRKINDLVLSIIANKPRYEIRRELT